MRRERTHLEMRHHGDRLALARHDHREGPFHLVEVLAEDPAEICARNQHQRVERSAGEDGIKGSSMMDVLVRLTGKATARQSITTIRKVVVARALTILSGSSPYLIM